LAGVIRGGGGRRAGLVAGPRAWGADAATGTPRCEDASGRFATDLVRVMRAKHGPCIGRWVGLSRLEIHMDESLARYVGRVKGFSELAG
jgi:hypothetical protein